MTADKLTIWFVSQTRYKAEDDFIEKRNTVWRHLMAIGRAAGGDFWWAQLNELDFILSPEPLKLAPYLLGLIAPIHKSEVKKWEVWQIARYRFAVPSEWAIQEPIVGLPLKQATMIEQGRAAFRFAMHQAVTVRASLNMADKPDLCMSNKHDDYEDWPRVTVHSGSTLGGGNEEVIPPLPTPEAGQSFPGAVNATADAKNDDPFGIEAALAGWKVNEDPFGSDTPAPHPTKKQKSAQPKSEVISSSKARRNADPFHARGMVDSDEEENSLFSTTQAQRDEIRRQQSIAGLALDMDGLGVVREDSPSYVTRKRKAQGEAHAGKEAPLQKVVEQHRQLDPAVTAAGASMTEAGAPGAKI